MNPASIDLFPRPRRIDVRGGDRLDVAALPVVRRVDASLPPEGFVLDVRPGGVDIRHADEAGARYAERTRLQLAAHPGGVPPLEVADHPDLAVRGYMLDVSRDRVPTRETLDRLVDVLALARFNQLQLYLEHAFAYRDHELVWRDASPLTHDDLRWLDTRCAAAGIELVANQNVFGHMGRWLAHDRYLPRAEAADGFELLPGVALPPSVLAPTPDNAAFALELLDELLDCVGSRRVHIGCDEAFELGEGASRDRVAATSRTAVFVEHVLRIAQPLLDRGYEVQIWDDMLRHHPELLATLPEGVVPVLWTYERPGAMEGIELPEWLHDIVERLGYGPEQLSRGFTGIIEGYAGIDRPFVLAPGTSSWNSFVGRWDNGQANLDDAIANAAAHGAAGILVTDWGDNGHYQPPSVSFPALVHAGARAWGADANADVDVAAVLDRHVFGDERGRLGDALLRLGLVWRRTGERSFNGSPLQAAMLPAQMHFVLDEPERDATAGVVDELDELLATVTSADLRCTDGATVVAELHAAARLARHGAWRLLEQAGGTAPSGDVRRADLRECVELQRAAWLARSRPGGLADSIGPLEAQLET